jgi:hypothetical protein
MHVHDVIQIGGSLLKCQEDSIHVRLGLRRQPLTRRVVKKVFEHVITPLEPRYPRREVAPLESTAPSRWRHERSGSASCRKTPVGASKQVCVVDEVRLQRAGSASEYDLSDFRIGYPNIKCNPGNKASPIANTRKEASGRKYRLLSRTDHRDIVIRYAALREHPGRVSQCTRAPLAPWAAQHNSTVVHQSTLQLAP